MIAADSDPMARKAQTDIHRFYLKVIQPALAEFMPTDDVLGGKTTDIDAFLERARVTTHNALCYEMRRTFALIVGALFERQLRSWLSGKMPGETKKIGQVKREDLVKLVEKQVGSSIGTDIESLWSVADAVRHGEGPSAKKLFQANPQFWNHMRTSIDLTWQSDLVGNMRICDTQLEQYTRAVLQFWYLAGASTMNA